MRLTTYLAMFLFLASSAKTWSTTHVVIWNKHEVYVGSDGLRQVTTGSSLRSCKIMAKDNVVLLASGHLADIHTEIEGNVISTTMLSDFQLGAKDILASHDNIQVKYTSLEAYAEKVLVEMMVRYDGQKRTEDRADYAIEGVLIWFSDGKPLMKRFRVNVVGWNERIVRNIYRTTSRALIPYRIYQFPQDLHLGQRNNDLATALPSIAKTNPTALVRLILDDTRILYPTIVGEPYGIVRLSKEGLYWIEGEALCKEQKLVDF